MEAEESAVGVGSEVVTLWNRLRGTAKIVSESRTHWTIPWFRSVLKIPKKRQSDRDCEGYRNIYRPMGGSVDVYLTEKGVADREYIERHRYALSQSVQKHCDADVLRKVAELVGYKETP